MAYPSLLHVQTTVDLLFQEFTIEHFATFFRHAPESPLFEEWVAILDRLGTNGYREAVFAACGFCMFDASVVGGDKLVTLYQTLLDVAKGVERSPPSLPHKGSSDPCYNFVYGLYAVCMATNAVPNMEDIGQIYGRVLQHGDNILRAFRDWCDQSVAVRRYQTTKLHLPQVLRLMHIALSNWDQPGQNTLPVQVIIGIERWQSDLTMGVFLSRYKICQNPYRTTVDAANRLHHAYTLGQQQNGHQMQAANPPDSDDPFITQAAPAAAAAPRRKRRAPRRAPKKLSAPKVEEDEEEDAHFEFEEQDDANDGDYRD